MERKPIRTYLIMKLNGGKPFTMKAKSERQVKRRLGYKSLDYLIQEVKEGVFNYGTGQS